MNEQELSIVDYLEKCYVGARMGDDVQCMVRLSRALAAFKFDPLAAPEGMFSREFLETYTSALVEE